MFGARVIGLYGYIKLDLFELTCTHGDITYVYKLIKYRTGPELVFRVNRLTSCYGS